MQQGQSGLAANSIQHFNSVVFAGQLVVKRGSCKLAFTSVPSAKTDHKLKSTKVKETTIVRC